MAEPLQLRYWVWSFSGSDCAAIDSEYTPTAAAPPEWQAPPADLQLTGHEIHVWRVDLTPTPLLCLALRRTLSADELARAKRLIREEDRQRFLLARGALRDILARYLTMQPGQLRFRYNAHGKPSLREICGERRQPIIDLRFNLSHTDGLALVAVTRGRRVGVDVERIRDDLSPEMVGRFFSPNEQEMLRSLPAHLQPLGFLNCWTRKEAYLKARGEGLTLPMDSFEVSLDPGAPAELLGASVGADESACWTIVELTPAPGHVAALAAER